jgi:TctA family transporter
MLTLGIPANPVMALMIGALMIQGIQPGPTIITEQATLFWGVVVSMWIGNVFLLVLNLPLIGLWVRMITVPYHLLFPAIMVFCAIGVYSLSNTTFDVYLMALFGVLGYIFHKIGCEPTPLLLGFVLGPPMEEFLRRALVLSEGRATVLVTEPLSAALLAAAAILLTSVMLPTIRKKREETFVSED